MRSIRPTAAVLVGAVSFACVISASDLSTAVRGIRDDGEPRARFDKVIADHAEELFKDGLTIFRDDTFGDEQFWGDTLKLHQAIEGANLGGVGPGVSPAVALQVGLKVDVDRSVDPGAEAAGRQFRCGRL